MIKLSSLRRPSRHLHPICLANRAFPGTARQGRCGAVQVSIPEGALPEWGSISVNDQNDFIACLRRKFHDAVHSLLYRIILYNTPHRDILQQ